ncbi:MAG: gamma-glutamyl-gamma-aminobutyrate hydrolase family protein [Actinomycetota bacterium]
MKPLIGLVGSRFTGDRITGNLDVLGSSPIDVYYADYSQAVIEAGGIPMWIPVDVDPADAIERLDGLLMTGGTDIDPARYGAERSGHVLEIVPERDEYEFATLAAAEARELPTLGICRGLQAINVHAGGTLHQHRPEQAFVDGPPDALVHDVALAEGSVLAECYGPTHRVNSLHHQQAAEIGDRLRVTGRAPDGCVEAIEHEELPWVAVQWHPEMLPTRATDPIFRWLVSSAS